MKTSLDHKDVSSRAFPASSIYSNVDQEIISFSGVTALNDSVMSCHDCPALVKCRTRPVTGYGDRNADILFIGEAPGRLGADVTGVPFTRDRSGKLFQKMLGYVGLTRSAPDDPFPDLHGAYVTNIVKCNPRDEDGRNRTPSGEEMKNCRKYLMEEIRLLSPKIIVPLGVPAARQIIGDNFNPDDFGRVLEINNMIVFPLWHPAYVIRGGGTIRLTERKYRRIFLRLKVLLNKVDPDFMPAEPSVKLTDFTSL